MNLTFSMLLIESFRALRSGKEGWKLNDWLTLQTVCVQEGPGISRDIWPRIRCNACPAGRCPTADPHTRDSMWVPWLSTPRNYGAWWRRWDRSALAGSFWARAVSVKRDRIYSKRAERCTINVLLKSMKVLEEKGAFVVITALDMHTTAVNKCGLKNINLFYCCFQDVP